MRVPDFIARYGGEEFAALLPDTDELGALYVAEQMRLMIETLDIAATSRAASKVTISIGAATARPREGGEPMRLFHEADRALYAAKASAETGFARGDECQSSKAVGLRPRTILLLADLFHPGNDLAVECLLNSDMGHCALLRCAMPMLFAGANQTTSPGRSSSTGPPTHCAHPRPDVIIKIWPSGCVCQAVRAPGSNVTFAARTMAGGVA